MERIEGAFRQATAAGAVIEVAGQSITIPLEKLKAIYFGVAPSPTAGASSVAQDALGALKAIRSVTTSGIAYRDYTQRLLDARVTVDRYLSANDSAGGAAYRAIRTAMLEYEFAGRVWLVQIDPGPDAAVKAGELMPHPDFATCTPIKTMVDRAKAKDPMSYGVQILVVRTNHLPEIWACASEQITEAERVATRH
jgi:hypothetical protein